MERVSSMTNNISCAGNMSIGAGIARHTQAWKWFPDGSFAPISPKNRHFDEIIRG
jgi:hypothetical protein